MTVTDIDQAIYDAQVTLKLAGFKARQLDSKDKVVRFLASAEEEIHALRDRVSSSEDIQQRIEEVWATGMSDGGSSEPGTSDPGLVAASYVSKEALAPPPPIVDLAS